MTFGRCVARAIPAALAAAQTQGATLTRLGASSGVLGTSVIVT